MGMSTRVGVGLIISAVVLGALIKTAEMNDPIVSSVTQRAPTPAFQGPKATVDGPGILTIEDDGTVANTGVVMQINRDGTRFIDMVFFGKDGMPAVRLRADGTVELLQEVDDAARAFWEAVSTSMPLCKEKQS